MIRSYNAGEDNDYYKFTQKERDTETGYDYFGARYYNSDLGRWLSIDPLVAKFPGWSSYNYVMNSPLIKIDPDGRIVDDSEVKDDKAYQEFANSEEGRKYLSQFQEGGEFAE